MKPFWKNFNANLRMSEFYDKFYSISSKTFDKLLKNVWESWRKLYGYFTENFKETKVVGRVRQYFEKLHR